MNEDEKPKWDVMRRWLILELFKSTFPTVTFDELDKYDLAYLAISLNDKIQKIRNPKYSKTSRQLTTLYLRDRENFKFTKLQKRLLKFMSDQQVKTNKELIDKLYGKKIHQNKDDETALRQLVKETREAIQEEGSVDAFKIITRKGGYQLSIDITDLSIYLKTSSKKITS